MRDPWSRDNDWSSHRHGTAGLTDLLDHMRDQKDKRERAENVQRLSKRGLMVCGPLLCIIAFLWLRPGSRSDASGSSRAMHCYFLLDRTGSMSSMSSAVISGFNEFLQQQKAQPGSMYMTLAQFNSENPFELRFSGQDLRAVSPLDSFKPSGQTPLYDALAAMIAHATSEQQQSEREVVIGIFSDGKENASRKHTRAEVCCATLPNKRASHSRAPAPHSTSPSV